MKTKLLERRAALDAVVWLWRWWFFPQEIAGFIADHFQVPRGEEETFAIGVLAVILIFLAVYFGLGFFPRRWSRTSRYAHNANFAAFEESFDKSHGRARGWCSFFSDLIHLSAGASAVEQLLQLIRTLRSGCCGVGAILPTDLRSPVHSTLGRIPTSAPVPNSGTRNISSHKS